MLSHDTVKTVIEMLLLELKIDYKARLETYIHFECKGKDKGFHISVKDNIVTFVSGTYSRVPNNIIEFDFSDIKYIFELQSNIKQFIIEQLEFNKTAMQIQKESEEH